MRQGSCPGVPVEQRPPPGDQKDASYEQKADQGLTGTAPRRPSHPPLPPGHLAPSFTQLVVVTPGPIVSCGPQAHKPHVTHGSQMGQLRRHRSVRGVSSAVRVLVHWRVILELVC